MSTTDLNTPEALADVLRSSAAWLKEAAHRLEAGDLDGARDMAKLGAFGVEGMPELIAQAGRPSAADVADYERR